MGNVHRRTKNWTEIHTAKLDALDEILEDNQDENLLIAYNYKTDLIRLKARYPDAVVLDNDPDIITRWNNGQIKILLAHPASAGMVIIYNMVEYYRMVRSKLVA